MAYLNTFPERSERSIFAHRPDRSASGPAKPGAGRLRKDGRGSRRTDAGGTEFLMASGVLGAARWLHRRGLVGAKGFRVALTLAERFSARGIAKWRAARRSDAANDA
ncbi:MAG TPA: hypothetical protein VK801_11420 [Caulobacteraceae bacterium]|jgi:hypothetical protein|nr:hypothetical protein [Caulobacteraceae bacterium]